jgi:hypothetical protein
MLAMGHLRFCCGVGPGKYNQNEYANGGRSKGHTEQECISI